MSFSRGKFGIEYNTARRQDETHRLRWIFAGLGVLVLASFVTSRFFRAEAPARSADAKAPPAPAVAPFPPPESAAPPPESPAPRNALPPTAARTKKNPAQAPKAPPRPARVSAPAVPSAAARRAARWEAAAENRPNHERTLLLRLAEAERLNRMEIVRDSLKKLRTREAMKDMQDPLSRRLGELNMKLFLAGSNGWARVVTVRRGDSVERLAREHGTTAAAVLALNAIRDSNRLRVGQKLLVPEFPRAMLAVGKRTGVADLSVKSAFFRRYYVKTNPSAKAGFYKFEGGRSCRAWLAGLGVTVTAVDMKELELFLAPGATLTLTDF